MFNRKHNPRACISSAGAMLWLRQMVHAPRAAPSRWRCSAPTRRRPPAARRHRGQDQGPPPRLGGMGMSHRLARAAADRPRRPLDFTFNGKRLQGHAGDTLASALLARADAGGAVLQVSPPARRRGLGRRGAERAGAGRRGSGSSPTSAPPRPSFSTGLQAASQNHWPSLDYDIGAVNNPRAVPDRGLLLQDVHPSPRRSGSMSTSPSSADRRAGPRPRPETAMPTATSILRLLRCAGDRRRHRGLHRGAGAARPASA
jgi:hypothetical protein